MLVAPCQSEAVCRDAVGSALAACNRTSSNADKSAIDAVVGLSNPASNPQGIAFS